MMHTFTLISAFTLICIAKPAPELAFRRYSSTFTKLVKEIFDNHFHKCDLILVQDEHFASNMNGWVSTLKYPYYSVTLDGKPFPDYTTWQKITKTTGFLCSNVLVTCKTYESCRIPDSVILYKMLEANGILLQERRSVLYVEEAEYDNTTIPFLESYQQQNVEKYTIPYMNEAKMILNELRSHITFIHEVKVRKQRSGELEKEEINNADVLYEAITFTPNWFPGGTPVLKSMWSSKHGFLVSPRFNLRLGLARPGGLATFCVSSKHILPFFDISVGGDIQGLGGALIKIFQQRFNFSVTFIEPHDKEFGRKGPNGEWSGVVGYLVRKEADFGLGQLTFTHERFDTGLRFSQALLVLLAVAVCPVPKPLPRYQILMYPFETSTWIWVFAASSVCILSVEIMQRIACRIFGLKITVGRKTFFIKLRRQRKLSWIQTLGPMFLRSIPVHGLPRRWGVLGLFSVWLMFTFIVSAYYTTILIGALTIFPKEPYIKSPFELIENEKTWAMSPLINQTLTNSKVPRERLLLERATPTHERKYDDEPMDIKVYKYINSTGNCGLAESTRSKYFLRQYFTIRVGSHEYSSVYISRDSILIGPMGWALREDMDFLVQNYLDNLFLEFRCYGFIVKTTSSWLNKEHKVGNGLIMPISMSSVEPVFLISGCCITISVVVFIVEVVTRKHRLLLPK